MDENIYEQEITEESLTASGDTSEPEGGADPLTASGGPLPLSGGVLGDDSDSGGSVSEGASPVLKAAGTVLKTAGGGAGTLDHLCANVYTIGGLNGAAYRVIFPTEGNSVCVRNDASDTIYLSLKPDADTTNDEVIPLPPDGIVNELYVPAALYITIGDAAGDVVVMRR